jgi:uncharacterized protein (TIGR03067 family)
MPRRLPTASALAAFLLPRALLRADDPPKGDKDLDGTWDGVSVLLNGKELPQPADGKMVVTISGGSLTLKIGDDSYTSTISVDASKTPKTIDLTPDDGKNKGKTMKAVYEVKGDELKVCHGDWDSDRPKELASKEGNGLMVFTFKRVKK